MAIVSCEKVTTVEGLIDALRIRVSVFIQEQGFPPGWEPDEVDKSAEHFISVVDDVVVATTRLRRVSPSSIKIERMAVLQPYRRQRIGAALTQHVIEQAQLAGVDRLWLDAQCQAQGFYERLHFTPVSGSYCRWHINVPHVTMDFSGWSART